MTATFYLLRHAAHDNVGSYIAGRTPGVHLGTDGKAQAERLGIRMMQEQFHAVVASPRERTQETAAAVAAMRPGISVETDAALDEIDFGSWSGRTFAELNKQKEWQYWNAFRSMAATPAGDTMLDVQRRSVGLILTMMARDPAGRFVLVSHADVIKAIVGHFLGLPIDAWHRFDISPASITTLVVGDWGSKLLTLNETIA